MKGYWARPEANAQVLRATDGSGPVTRATWMRMAISYIHDRIKDMIVSGGETVSGGNREALARLSCGIVDAGGHRCA